MSVSRCLMCGTTNYTGIFCSIACVNLYIQLQQQNAASSPFGVPINPKVYPGTVIDCDYMLDSLQFLPQNDANWPQAKEQADKLGMPWNFYQALLTVARALRDHNLLSASITKEGCLKLTYPGYDVNLKICEIEVEPNGK
jgi:hypothetical protein